MTLDLWINFYGLATLVSKSPLTLTLIMCQCVDKLSMLLLILTYICSPYTVVLSSIYTGPRLTELMYTA